MTSREDSVSVDAVKMPTIPWWRRVSRWRQQSEAETRAVELCLMNTRCPSSALEVVDTTIEKGVTMHHVHLKAEGQGEKTPIVLLPGYASGAGIWWRNMMGLSEKFDVYALDWLGTGLSTRVAFEAKDTESAEAFFVDSLDKWRAEMQMGEGTAKGKMVLVGHSLGGYLVGCYALKYPQHVQQAILVCPAGVPAQPEGWKEEVLAKTGGWKKAIYKTIGWAWEKGVTPASFIRGVGPVGPSLVEKHVSRRFNIHGEGLTREDERKALAQYIYLILADKASGDQALRRLLAPGAWAHHPLSKRLGELSDQVKLSFVYGCDDWMRFEHAEDVCNQLKKEGRVAKGPGDLNVAVLPDSGHFCFCEQVDKFNEAIINAISA